MSSTASPHEHRPVPSPVRRQRWLYAFRNRHGFTDDADGAFEQLWHGDGLTWADIDRLSEATAATNPGPLSR